MDGWFTGVFSKEAKLVGASRRCAALWIRQMTFLSSANGHIYKAFGHHFHVHVQYYIQKHSKSVTGVDPKVITERCSWVTTFVLLYHWSDGFSMCLPSCLLSPALFTVNFGSKNGAMDGRGMTRVTDKETIIIIITHLWPGVTTHSPAARRDFPNDSSVNRKIWVNKKLRLTLDVWSSARILTSSDRNGQMGFWVCQGSQTRAGHVFLLGAWQARVTPVCRSSTIRSDIWSVAILTLGCVCVYVIGESVSNPLKRAFIKGIVTLF